VLAAGGPGEVAERLKSVATVNDVDPVAHLEPSNEREYLVRRQVERMQGEAEVGVLDQRKEAVRAVARPLQPDDLARSAHLRLDECRAFAHHLNREPIVL